MIKTSARLALEGKLDGDQTALGSSGLPEFERDFQHFLMNDKGRTFLRSVAMQARKLASDERNSLAVAERSARLSADELRQRAGELERLFEDARARRDDVPALLRKEVDAIVSIIEANLDSSGPGRVPACFRKRRPISRLRKGSTHLSSTSTSRSRSCRSWEAQLVVQAAGQTRVELDEIAGQIETVMKALEGRDGATVG